ncbi:hypothetical protein Tco_1121164 [Tanacetum coccineum]|uniref:Uncharacterized protein n=1 Tax=Tanacetum coccineum TaxID=301880 RepID=A0ABQ5IWX3_9ASTR
MNRSYHAFAGCQLGKATANLSAAQFSRLLWTFSSKQTSSGPLQRHQQYLLSTFNNSGILFALTGKLEVLSVNWTSNGSISIKTHSEMLFKSHQIVRCTWHTVTTNDMFQPWRALATIINLCLTGKTSGFERPRAPVLQILWGIVNRAHIDYAERMWEEFTQSIHTFTEDKRRLAQHL